MRPTHFVIWGGTRGSMDLAYPSWPVTASTWLFHDAVCSSLFVTPSATAPTMLASVSLPHPHGRILILSTRVWVGMEDPDLNYWSRGTPQGSSMQRCGLGGTPLGLPVPTTGSFFLLQRGHGALGETDWCILWWRRSWTSPGATWLLMCFLHPLQIPSTSCDLILDFNYSMQCNFVNLCMRNFMQPT